MTTFAEAIASRAQQWTAIIRIEGFGPSLSSSQLTAMGSDARACLCSTVPDYADESIPVWRDYLPEMPGLTSERGSVWGGFPDLGELSWAVVDFGDYLTQQLATDAKPITAINATTTATATEIRVKSSAAISASSVVWVGCEALHVITVIDGTTILVTRGYLSTTATAHDTGDRVFAAINYIKQRRADLYIVPTDAASRSEEKLVGQYVIDHGPSWAVSDDGGGVWSFAARSQSQHLDRMAPISTRRGKITSVGSHGVMVEPEAEAGRAFLSSFRQWSGDQDDGGASIYLQAEKGEVIAVAGPQREMSQANGAAFIRRDVLGSGRADLQPGDFLTQVMCAEHDEASAGGCSFRYSDPASTSSSASPRSTWTNTANPFHILLCIMTSAASDDDGLWFSNHAASRPNFSCLPPGFGLGLPVSNISVDSFLLAAQRSQHIRLTSLVYGSRPESFAAFASREILQPLGAYIVNEEGLAKIVLPGLPLMGSATVTLGAENILTREVGDRQRLPILDIARGTYDDTTAIEYKVGPKPSRSVTVTAADASELFSARRTYGTTDSTKTIAVPGGNRAEAAHLGRALAEPHLWRMYRPAYDIDVEYDLSLWNTKIGDAVAITLDEMPNQAATVRGWSSIQCELTEREPIIDEDGGARIRAHLIGFTQSSNNGRIAPSAHIISASTSAPNEVLTVTANQYTDTDALGSGVPTSDAAGFVTGDVVRCYNAAGVKQSGTNTQAVVSVAGNTITIDGDFGGLTLAGLILVFANYDDSIAQQREKFAYFSDLTACTVGASSADPYIFGRG